MSLVDYPSDEEDEHAEAEEKPDDDEDDRERHFALHQEAIHSSSDGTSASSSTTLVANAQRTQPGANVSHTSIGAENVIRLPDAAELLASWDVTQNTSISNITSVPSTVTDASVSRKRADMNGSSNAPQRKILRGSLPPSRVIPDTAGGSLLPPQLRGRSNVTTEDLEKLFTRRPRSKP